jgi:hypothetical protein
MPAHEYDDIRLPEAELMLNRFEWRAIFPRHFYDSRNIAFTQQQRLMPVHF